MDEKERKIQSSSTFSYIGKIKKINENTEQDAPHAAGSLSTHTYIFLQLVITIANLFTFLSKKTD
jgi:hypothetical protein